MLTSKSTGPDYKELGCLKRDYPDVPIIALTATANKRVQEDIVATLRMRGPIKLQRSFNRPNLKYEVRNKSKSILEDIATFIKAGHLKSCGIIYCSSKKQCEDTADKLRRLYKISAKHYHAVSFSPSSGTFCKLIKSFSKGMDKNERSRIQKGWQAGEFFVICATIASVSRFCPPLTAHDRDTASAWASTSQTCATSSTLRFLRVSKPTTRLGFRFARLCDRAYTIRQRKRVVRAATARRRSACCSTRTRTRS